MNRNVGEHGRAAAIPVRFARYFAELSFRWRRMLNPGKRRDGIDNRRHDLIKRSPSPRSAEPVSLQVPSQIAAQPAPARSRLPARDESLKESLRAPFIVHQ